MKITQEPDENWLYLQTDQHPTTGQLAIVKLPKDTPENELDRQRDILAKAYAAFDGSLPVQR